MPHYLSIGVSKQDILHDTINGLRVYDEAYKLKREMQDEMLYLSGIYTYEAVSVALSNAFRGKGKKPIEYRDKPILQSMKPVTEEDYKRKRLEVTHRLDTLRANYHLAKQQAEKNNG